MNRVSTIALALSLGGLVAVPALAAPAANGPANSEVTNQALQQEVIELQKEVNALKASQRQQAQAQNAQLQHQVNEVHVLEHHVAVEDHEHAATAPKGSAEVNGGSVVIGPYIKSNDNYGGTELVSRVSSMRQSSRLLLQEYNTLHQAEELGLPLPSYPRLTLSGQIEGTFSYNQPYVGPNQTAIDFTDSELETYINVSPWVSGYADIKYDNTPGHHSSIDLNRAYITLGNLSKLPVYTTIGQLYVPFGRYSSSMVSAPTTQVLGRTLAKSIVVGYQQVGSNRLHAEVYAFQGTTPIKGKTNNNQWGADVGYEYSVGKISGEVGASYISTLADSQGLQSYFVDNTFLLTREVPAVAAYASIGYDPVSLTGEYVTVLKSFNPEAVSFNGEGASPKAYNLELAYAFGLLGNKPSSIALGFGGTEQAYELGLPHYRYSATFNTALLRHTNLAIEYRHDINYSKDEVGNGGVALGKSDNVITAQFDVYF